MDTDSEPWTERNFNWKVFFLFWFWHDSHVITFGFLIIYPPTFDPWIMMMNLTMISVVNLGFSHELYMISLMTQFWCTTKTMNGNDLLLNFQLNLNELLVASLWHTYTPHSDWSHFIDEGRRKNVKKWAADVKLRANQTSRTKQKSIKWFWTRQRKRKIYSLK